MIDFELFPIPVATSMVEAVCNSCKKGFYRPTGQAFDLITGPNKSIQKITHKCQTCGDVVQLEKPHPWIRYDSILPLNWTDPLVRKAWGEEHGKEN